MAAFGFDIHGVLDTYKSLRFVCEALVKAGHEVHILTGATKEVALQHLKEVDVVAGQHYNYLFSVQDDLLERGIGVTYNADTPRFADHDWDSAKALYCKKHEIKALFDDSPVYGTYMGEQTEFIHVGTRVERK